MLTSDQLRRDWQRQRQGQRQREEQQQQQEQRVNSSMASMGKGKGRSNDEEGSSSNDDDDDDDDNDDDESSGADVSASRAAPKPLRPPPAAAPARKRGVQVEVLIDNTRWRPSGTALASSSRQQQPRRSLPLTQPTAGSEPRKTKIVRKSTGGGEAIRKPAAAIVAVVSDSSDECGMAYCCLVHLFPY